MREERVGFIGLGRMGRGMASNLLTAGYPLTVFDVSGDAVEALVARGATAAPDPAALASASSIVLTCLPYTPEVEAALFGERGVMAGAHDGLAIVDATTQNHAAAVAIAARVEAGGVGYSDCPISGMPFRAEDGTLTIMFGGAHAAFERARPLLEAMGEFVVHCGPVGSGQTMKALNNIVYNVNIAAICEVMPLAVATGLDVEQVARVMTSGSSRSFASEYFVPRILDGRFEGDFSMGAAYKDIVNVQEIAARLGAATPVVNAMVATYQNTMAMGHADEPKSAMIKLYERVLGLEVRRGTGNKGR